MSTLQKLIQQRGATACAFRAVDCDDPLAAFEALRSGAHSWLLDSALPSERLGRYSFVGADPYLLKRLCNPLTRSHFPSTLNRV